MIDIIYFTAVFLCGSVVENSFPPDKSQMSKATSRQNSSPIQPKQPYNYLVKLQQGQIWNQGDQYFLILHLERLEVQYKTFKNLAHRKGPHHHGSKKEFCRLIKHATLLTPEEINQARTQTAPADPASDSTPPQTL